MSNISTLNLPAAVQAGTIDGVPCIQVESGFSIVRYLRNTTERAYLWIAPSGKPFGLPLIDADLSERAQDLEETLRKVCRTNEFPWVLLVRDGIGRHGVIGGKMDVGCELSWSAGTGRLVIKPVVAARVPTAV
jgi:hypothetical protein